MAQVQEFDFDNFIFIGSKIRDGIYKIPADDLKWYKEQKERIEIAFIQQDTIPMVSSYDVWKDGQGNLKIEDIEPLMQKLHEAWEIACEGYKVKYGDTDEADRISGIMSGIQQKYQGKATLEQRTKWRN